MLRHRPGGSEPEHGRRPIVAASSIPPDPNGSSRGVALAPTSDRITLGSQRARSGPTASQLSARAQLIPLRAESGSRAIAYAAHRPLIAVITLCRA